MHIIIFTEKFLDDSKCRVRALYSFIFFFKAFSTTVSKIYVIIVSIYALLLNYTSWTKYLYFRLIYNKGMLLLSLSEFFLVYKITIILCGPK